MPAWRLQLAALSAAWKPLRRELPIVRRKIYPDELALLYRLMGEAVWFVQCFENVLVTFVTLKLRLGRPIGAQEAYEILAKERRRPLGPLVKDATVGDIIPSNLRPRADAFVVERNWLVHRLVHESGDDLYTDEGRASVLQRVEAVAAEAIQLRKALAVEMDHWCKEQGVDTRKTQQIAEAQIRKLRGS